MTHNRKNFKLTIPSFLILKFKKNYSEGLQKFENVDLKRSSRMRRVWIVCGWGLMIWGLGWFLSTCREGHVLECGGFDPADCPMIFGNVWLMTGSTGVSFFVLLAGLWMLWSEKPQRRFALGFMAIGALLFYLMFSSFPKFC